MDTKHEGLENGFSFQRWEFWYLKSILNLKGRVGLPKDLQTFTVSSIQKKSHMVIAQTSQPQPSTNNLFVLMICFPFPFPHLKTKSCARQIG